jgi:hypothetical protein
MSRRANKVMFRIGGEDELLDPPPPPTSTPPLSPTKLAPEEQPRAACPADDAPGVSVRVSSGVSEPPTASVATDPTETLGPPTGNRSVRPVQASPAVPMSSISTSGISVSAALRSRGTQHHRHGRANREDRPIAPTIRQRRPRPTGAHGWITWLNALILAVLIVAAVIGHDPSSTPATSRGSSTANTTANSFEPTRARSDVPPRRSVRERRKPSKHPVRARPNTKVARGDPSVEFVP